MKNYAKRLDKSPQYDYNNRYLLHFGTYLCKEV